MQIVTKQIKQDTNLPAVIATHRIVVIDCSGSMGSSLPKIRTALKNKIPNMVQPEDCLSIVWFSGRNQFGTLMEAVKISSLTDLSNINKSIDRYLTTVGMTAFVQPLEEVGELVKRVPMPATMFFMTDGFSTCGESKKQILDATRSLANLIDAATFVEFSWYADHNLLTEMAEELGGSLIQSDDFDKYVMQLETELGGSTGGKKQKVSVESGVEYVIAPVASGFIVAKVQDSEAVLPGNCTSYTYQKGAGEITSITSPTDALYLAASFVQRGKVDHAVSIAEKIGDVDVYQQLQNAFSKQDYANVVESLIDYGNGKSKLYSTAPKNLKLKVKADAYNVLQLLMDLTSVEGNQLHLSHPSFKYTSIGPASETAEVNGFVPKFESNAEDVKANITTLKFDEDRPNVSMLVRRNGYVMLPESELFASNRFDTYVWRNYTIVKDGIINVQFLPLILTPATHALLTSHGVINESYVAGKTYVVDTKKLPIINRKMVEDVSAEKLASNALSVYRLKCIQKVINSKLKDEVVKDAKFVELYGQEATDYLKEYGITEGGFSPKKIKVDSGDSYMSKELATKLKGMSSIPKVEDVQTAIDKKKALSVPLQYLQAGIDMVDVADDLVALKKRVKSNIDALMAEIVKTKFSVIIGKKWFKEFATLDENTYTVKCPYTGSEVLCTFELKEKEIS